MGTIDKRANTDHEVHSLIKERWSPRSFSQDRIISEDELKQLLEAARWAASSYNEQPWRFVYAFKGTSLYEQLLGSINEFNRNWASNAPVLMLAVAKRTFSHNGAENRHSWYDLGASVATLSIQATNLGISLHQMAGFDAKVAAEMLELDHEFEPVVMIAAGYAESAELLPENLKKAEVALRSRKALDELVLKSES